MLSKDQASTPARTHGNYVVRRATANGVLLQLEPQVGKTSSYPPGPMGWPCATSEGEKLDSQKLCSLSFISLLRGAIPQSLLGEFVPQWFCTGCGAHGSSSSPIETQAHGWSGGRPRWKCSFALSLSLLLFATARTQLDCYVLSSHSFAGKLV